MCPKPRFSLMLCLVFVGSLFFSQSQGFIERKYTIHEILDACTNVVFGKVKHVDAKLLRGIIEVEEDAKGRSNLDEIRMNFATGQYRRESSPPKMVGLLKVGMPMIVFYRQTYGIQSLGYVDGTWFQTHSHGGYSTGEWWGFTHMDPYMSRTFSDSTTEFQKIIQAILAGEKWVATPKDAVKVLVLTGNSTRPIVDRLDGTLVTRIIQSATAKRRFDGWRPFFLVSARIFRRLALAISSAWSQVPVYTNTVSYEYHTIRSVREAGKRVLAHEATQEVSLPGLDEADILWLGQGEIANHHYLLNKSTERKIKKFVKQGGIVIVSGQDSGPDRPCETGWLVGKLEGVERPPTHHFKITKQGKKLFSEPNQIQPEQLMVDDAWTDWGKNHEILATTNGGKDLAVGVRKYGKGMYLITSMRNDDQGTVAMNKDLMENILYYAASWSRD